MSLFSILRGKWRGHDKKLAERALHDKEVVQELTEYDKAVNPALDDFKSDGPGSRLGTFSGARRAREIRRALATEDELEHEQPTAEEAASNELAPEAEEPK